MDKDPAIPLLVGRGFLATASAVIDYKKARIAVGEGVTRSVFGVKEITLDDEEIPHWTTLGKQESYGPRPSADGIVFRKMVDVGIKSLLEVTAAQVREVNWDQQVVSELVALRNFAKKTWVAASKGVMENGNAPLITKVVEGVETIIAPITAEEKAQRRLELKARSTLLMGIPNEHQLKFNSIKDAKSLLQAVEKSISREDINQKFLRSLSPEWNTHTIVWRNKHEIDTLSMDDLYNNLKIYEPEVNGTSSSSTNTQNIAFVSSNSTSSTNGAVTIALGATTASTQATAAKWQMAMLTMRARRFLKNTGREFSVNGTETI
ncbi:hypothetical protein Tco_1368437, partial [Tanacetum coccineum]